MSGNLVIMDDLCHCCQTLNPIIQDALQPLDNGPMAQSSTHRQQFTIDQLVARVATIVIGQIFF